MSISHRLVLVQSRGVGHPSVQSKYTRKILSVCVSSFNHTRSYQWQNYKKWPYKAKYFWFFMSTIFSMLLGVMRCIQIWNLVVQFQIVSEKSHFEVRGFLDFGIKSQLQRPFSRKFEKVNFSLIRTPFIIKSLICVCVLYLLWYYYIIHLIT